MDEKLSVAPMMEWTDRHFRFLLRGITKKTVFYTEMVVDDAAIHSPNLDFLVGKNIEEQPSVIQLGGSNPETLARSAEICAQYGGCYDEINLNCGCPSQRVSKHCFGAKLMLQPDLVRQIVNTMQRRVQIPITVKCRIGVDDVDSYQDLCKFIQCVHEGGVKKFIIHARKAFLNGLNPKQNRDIPPLKYEVVHQLVSDFPDLIFILNGGITTFNQALSHMNTNNSNLINNNNNVDNYLKLFDVSIHNSLSSYGEEVLSPVHGVMIGRTAYSNPCYFAKADSTFYNVPDPSISRRELLDRYCNYCEFVQSMDNGIIKYTKHNEIKTPSTSILLKPVHNIMNGLKHNSMYKIALNDVYMKHISGPNGTPNPSCRDIIEEAMEVIKDEDLDRILSQVGEDRL